MTRSGAFRAVTAAGAKNADRRQTTRDRREQKSRRGPSPGPGPTAAPQKTSGGHGWSKWRHQSCGCGLRPELSAKQTYNYVYEALFILAGSRLRTPGPAAPRGAAGRRLLQILREIIGRVLILAVSARRLVSSRLVSARLGNKLPVGVNWG